MIIAHASEFLDVADPAFVHAAGFAARSGVPVRGLHVARGPAAEPSPPNPSGLLARWGTPATAFEHRWLAAPASDDVSEALLELIEQARPALLVTSTHERGGLERLVLGSIAESVARNCRMPVLIVPHLGPFLVSAQTGAVTIERVLMLVGTRDEAAAAAQALTVLTTAARVGGCTVELLHVKDGSQCPRPALPPEFDVIRRGAEGPIERAAAEATARFDPQLIVMATRGHDQLSDVVFSSHTERVLHAVRLPLLWVPLD